MQLVRGSMRRFGDLVLRRGSVFFEEIEVMDEPSSTGCYEAVDLNGSVTRSEIRTGSDVDGTVIATFVDVPLDLTNGLYGVGMDQDATDAFLASLTIGTAYFYVDDELLASRNVRVKEPDEP